MVSIFRCVIHKDLEPSGSIVSWSYPDHFIDGYQVGFDLVKARGMVAFTMFSFHGEPQNPAFILFFRRVIPRWVGSRLDAAVR